MNPAVTSTATAAHPLAPRASERALVTAAFFAFSISLGLWAGSIPALMRQTGLGVQGLGAVLALHTAVYITAMALGGQLARFVAPWRLMVGAMLAIVPCACWLFSARSVPMLALALAALGAGSGLLDLAMNTEGTALERRLGRRVLLGMHAAASASFAIGAITGSLIATEAGPRWCALVVLAVLLPVALALHRAGPGPREAPAPVAIAAGDVPARPAALAAGFGSGVLRIGVVLGLAISSEVAAQMWSARFLEHQARDLAAFAGAGAAFFTGCQSALRLFGDALRRRLGDVRAILASLVVAALGFAVVAASSSFALSLAGFALIGLGTACVVPCCFALIAQRAQARAAAALGMASLIAGVIRIPTPLLLGAVAARWSDSWIFAGVGAALLLAFVLVRREAAAAA